MLTPSASTVAGVGNFSQCGAPDAHAVYVSLATETLRVCEPLAVSLANMPIISTAWCEAGNAPFGGSAHPGIDGEAALLACVPDVRR